jgi:rhodanese-related sulfurtransferase
MRRIFIASVGAGFIMFGNLAGVHAELTVRHTVIIDSIGSTAPILSLKQFKKLRSQAKVMVLDTRSGDDFLKGFIPNSINIGFKGPFDKFLLQIFPDKTQKLLLIADLGDAMSVSEHLSKLGYTNVMGVLDGGIWSWQGNEKTVNVSNITARKFLEKSNQGHIVDVRTNKEFAGGHIDNAMNIPLTDFVNFDIVLKAVDDQVYVHCQSGYRSAIAISILSAKGFKNICNIQGGYRALQEEIKENQ